MKNILVSLSLVFCSILGYSQTLETVYRGMYRPSEYPADDIEQSFEKTVRNDIALKAAIVSNDADIETNTLNIASNVSTLDGARYKTDTTDLFYWCIGDGLATDSSDFDPSLDYFPMRWNNQDSAKITKVHATLLSGVGSDTLGIRIAISDTLGDTTPVYITVDTMALDSTTAVGIGKAFTTFANPKIAPGNIGWLEVTDTVALRKPIRLIVTASGIIIDSD